MLNHPLKVYRQESTMEIVWKNICFINTWRQEYKWENDYCELWRMLYTSIYEIREYHGSTQQFKEATEVRSRTIYSTPLQSNMRLLQSTEHSGLPFWTLEPKHVFKFFICISCFFYFYYLLDSSAEEFIKPKDKIFYKSTIILFRRSVNQSLYLYLGNTNCELTLQQDYLILQYFCKNKDKKYQIIVSWKPKKSA